MIFRFRFISFGQGTYKLAEPDSEWPEVVCVNVKETWHTKQAKHQLKSSQIQDKYSAGVPIFLKLKPEILCLEDLDRIQTFIPTNGKLDCVCILLK